MRIIIIIIMIMIMIIISLGGCRKESAGWRAPGTAGKRKDKLSMGQVGWLSNPSVIRPFQASGVGCSVGLGMGLPACPLGPLGKHPEINFE